MRPLPNPLSVVLLALLLGMLAGCLMTPEELARQEAAERGRTLHRDESGDMEAALFRAACYGQTEVAQRLLERGANVNSVSQGIGGYAGYSALQCAAVNGHAPMVSLLLRYGADREYNGNGRGTALELAKSNGHASVVKILEDAPAAPAASPPKRPTPAPSAESPPPPIY